MKTHYNELIIILLFGFLRFSIQDSPNKTANVESFLEVVLESSSVYYGLGVTAERLLNAESSDCIREISRTVEGIRNREIWALKLMDASGSPKNGIYWGNTYWLGSRKQCLAAESGQAPKLSPGIQKISGTRKPGKKDNIPPFPVEYFAAYFRHNSTFQMYVHWQNESLITLGLCVASSCSPHDLSLLLQAYLSTPTLYYNALYNTTLHLEGVRNTEDNFNVKDTMTVVFLSWTGFVLVMGVLGTMYDFIFHQTNIKDEFSGLRDKSVKIANGMMRNGLNNNGTSSEGRIDESNNTFSRILIGFSWYTNFKIISNRNLGKDTLAPIVGLRFLLTNFIIFGHSYLFLMDYFDNRTQIFMYSDSVVGQIFGNSAYGVDLFFFLGGFLTIYTLSKSKDLAEGARHTNWSLFKVFIRGVFRRFRRLTPVYAYILLMIYVNSSYKSSLSAFWTNERNDLQCARYWWSNLLYINNIHPGAWDTMCMSWSWYLACDMQFYLVVSFVYVLSRKYFKSGVFLIFGLLFGSIITIGIITYVNDYKPFLDHFYQMAPLVYYPPWMRIGPYITGALYGYLYCNLGGRLDIRKTYIYILWITALALICYLEFGFIDKNFSPLKSVLHTSLSRIGFVVGFGWIILACLTGHGGFLNSIFCSDMMRPFSHLTYTAYLANPMVIYSLITNTEAAWQFDEAIILLVGNGLIVVTYMVSLVLVLGVEMPMDKLINVLLDEKNGRYQLRMEASRNVPEECRKKD